MKVLFVVSHPGFLRNFESGLRFLVSRGHDVHVHLGKDADADSVTGSALQALDRIGSLGGTFSTSVAPGPLSNAWSALGTDLRMARDFWRYLAPEYDDAVLLRERTRAEAPAFASRLARSRPFRLASVRVAIDRLVHGIERRLPLPDEAGALLDAHRPDVVIVTPLIYIRSEQVYVVRAARQRRIPVVYASGSWDHLTTKGLVHEEPDLTLVWNDAQIEECVNLHGLPRARCRATGAQAFDHWFGRQPLVDRTTFRAGIGVPDDRPLLLYLCSSTFIAGDERPFVREWLTALRAAGEPVRTAAVLIRPHPQNAGQWRDEVFDDGLTVVWPRAGANPVSDSARADFYHSIYFSDAVIGVNTSAQIESAIVGRPVFSILSSRYAGTQAGTLHFRHLQRDGGGLLHTADSLGEHAAQLAATLRAPAERDAQSARFVATFVRPAGGDRPAGEVFAEAVEGVQRALEPLKIDWRAWVVTRLLAPLAPAADAAARLRATKASTRFQSWFIQEGAPFIPGHLRSGAVRRLACVAATPEDVERFVSITEEVARAGGRTLLCVPDGSAAGAAAKKASDRLQRCVIIGLPQGGSRRAKGATRRLLLRKFRAEIMIAFEDSMDAPVVRELSEAARGLGLPVTFVTRQATYAQIVA